MQLRGPAACSVVAMVLVGCSCCCRYGSKSNWALWWVLAWRHTGAMVHCELVVRACTLFQLEELAVGCCTCKGCYTLLCQGCGGLL